MFTSLSQALRKPQPYEKTDVAFWDDAHISQQMLAAHLDPDFEGASRKPGFIEESVAWIREAVPPSEHPLLLDLGCGPGLYAEKFTDAGYCVTGTDLSKRSIGYAQAQAAQQGLAIDYRCQNYLALDLARQFDFATMIYCDFGALSPQDRALLLGRVRRHIRPQGRFLLDVFSLAQLDSFQEKQTWEVCPHGGFWRREPYCALNGCYKYPGNATLEQTTVVSDGGITNYYIWTSYFSQETLVQEVTAAGFGVLGVFGDVAGAPFRPESPTLAVLLEA